MSTGDFLFQGNLPTAFTNQITSTSTMPDWWQAAAQGLISRASQIAAQPFPTYSGPQVAGMDPLQQNAYNRVNFYVPGVNQQLSNANNMATTAGKLFDQNDFSQFMNPYTSNVVNDIATLGNRNLIENVLPKVNDTFTGAGQFGSSRNADFTLRAIRDNQQTISQQQNQALNQGFQNSMQNYQNAQQNLGEQGKNLGALAALTQQQGQGQLAFENALGTQNQQLTQKNLDVAKTDFMNQANYPLQMLNQLNSVIRGFQPAGGTYSYGTTPVQGTGNLSPLQSIPNILNASYGSQSNQ